MQRISRVAPFAFILAAIALLGVCQRSRADESLKAATPGRPDRESELLAIVADAQNQYATGHSTSPAKDARMAMQVHVIPFMRQSPAAEDWVGTFKGAGTTPGGNHWITLDIGDGATVSTWLNERDDQNAGTLIRDRTPIFAVAKAAKLGQPIVFSATVLNAVLATDDDMVARPQFIVRFSKLKIAQ